MRCGGCPFTTPVIEASEIYKRDILIVGEAPGKTEIRKGKPFVGPSGDLLWKTLATFGVKREDCAVTNAMECFIPQAVYDKKASVVQEPAMSCRHRLVDEIRVVKPNLVMALGNIAMQSLLQDFSMKITNTRGTIHDLLIPGRDGEEDFETKVLATFHPAAILRNPNDFRKFRRDLAYAHHLSKGGTPKSPGETEYIAIESPDDPRFAEAVAEIYKSPKDERFDKWVVGADIETNSLDPLSGGVLAIGFSPRKNFTVIFSEDCIASLYDLLTDEEILFVWHNGKFDTKFLQRAGIPARVDHDTILLHYCLDEQKGTHDLKQLSTYHLGAGDYSGEFKEYMPEKGATFADAPKHALYTYLSKDCDYTRQLFYIFYSQVSRDKNLNFLYTKLLIPLSAFLLKVEQRGIWANPEYLDVLKIQLEKEIEDVKAELLEIVDEYWDELEYAFGMDTTSVPDQFNPGSPKQLQWLLYQRMRLRPTNRKRNTNEETLRSIPPNPVVDKILQYRGAKKKLGTYVDGMRKHIGVDGRIHGTFMLFGTTTGRIASADPNTQNIPREKNIKDIFQAPKGRYIMDLDLAQAELRVLAALSGDETLTNVFKSGRDLHSETAELIWGPNSTKEDRTKAKSVNFGICYGLTAGTLVKQKKAKNERAGQKMIDGWMRAYPVAWKWLQTQRGLPIQGKYAESPFGRRRRFPLITEKALNGLENESSNHAIQGTASDINLILCMEIDEILETKYDALIVNIVHDSIIIECPEDPEIVVQIEKLAQTHLSKVAKEWLHTDVPFKMDGKFGKSWGSAEDITDELRSKYL